VHGVPIDLDLSFLHGAELIQVCIGQYQLQFHFHPVGSVSVEGGWELRDATGAWIEGAARSDNRGERPPCHLHKLLGRRVAATEVRAPQWFALRFEGGDVLRVFDDSVQYESFSIQPGNIFV
jgi:hypothetical protein